MLWYYLTAENPVHWCHYHITVSDTLAAFSMKQLNDPRKAARLDRKGLEKKNALTSDGHARGAPVQTQASWLHATTVSVGCAEPTLLRMSQSVCFRLERNLSARVCEQQVQGNDKEHGGLASWLIKMKRLVAPSVYLQLHTHYSLCCLSLSPRPLRLTEPTFWPHAFPPR